MLDRKEGRIGYGVLATGGVLGLGEKVILVRYHAFMPHPLAKKLILDYDLGQLAEEKGAEAGKWAGLNRDLEWGMWRGRGLTSERDETSNLESAIFCGRFRPEGLRGRVVSGDVRG